MIKILFFKNAVLGSTTTTCAKKEQRKDIIGQVQPYPTIVNLSGPFVLFEESSAIVLGIKRHNTMIHTKELEKRDYD